MTKQEVQNNIRYNENLVNQYKREIMKLAEQIDSLNSRIRTLNNTISDLRANQQQLEKQLDELTRLHVKLNGLLDQFSERQAKRVANFNKNKTTGSGLRIIDVYIGGMNELLSGREYRNACNGIVTAIEKVKSQIQAQRRKIDSLQRQMSTARSNLDSSNAEVNRCQSRKSQRLKDLSYRRLRVEYWKNQLQYAT